MAKVRLYYGEDDGPLVRIEHRADEEYTAENVPADLNGYQTLIVDSSELEGIPPDELTVRRQQPARRRREEAVASVAGALVPPEPARISDADWLRLFRDHAEASGLFNAPLGPAPPTAPGPMPPAPPTPAGPAPPPIRESPGEE